MTETVRGRRADSTALSYIYVLVDPRTSKIRYVGKTSKPLEKRLSQHVTRAKKGYKGHRDSWIRQLLCEDLVPEIRPIEDGYWSCEKADNREIYWISEFRTQGEPLTNMTNGGDGNKGVVFSPQARAAITAANKRNWADPEYRERLLKIRQESWDKNREKRSSDLAEITRKRWADPDCSARKTLAGEEYRARRSAIASSITSTPEGRERMRRNGSKTNLMRRSCNDCGKISTPSGLAIHQKATGCKGYTALTESQGI